MAIINYGWDTPKRMEELWDWVIAIDAWDYCDPSKLSELLNTEPVPEELRPIISQIVRGERTPNKRGAAKLKIPASERMKVAGSISAILGLIKVISKEAEYPDGIGVVGLAARERKEPIEMQHVLNTRSRECIEKAATHFNVSIETIENVIRDFREKAKNWPNI